MLIVGSSILLLVLIVTVFLVTFNRRDAQNPSTERPVTATNPSITPIAGLPEEPLELPDNLPNDTLDENLPVALTAAAPAELWTKISDNSSPTYASYDITYTSEEQAFEMVITTSSRLDTDDLISSDTAKILPPTYPYNAADFETLAIVEGKQILVSKTGAEDLVQSGDTVQLESLPRMNPKNSQSAGTKNEYYLYQRYGDGVSEYLSIYTANPGDSPSYNQHLTVRYSITSAEGNQNWTTYKQWLQQVIESLEKR